MAHASVTPCCSPVDLAQLQYCTAIILGRRKATLGRKKQQGSLRKSIKPRHWKEPLNGARNMEKTASISPKPQPR
jgi:hypothetical protein